MVGIRAPTTAEAMARAAWTQAGQQYRQECRDAKDVPEYEAGEHYVAKDGEDRILLPDLPSLQGLRHRWCWEKRSRLHLPTWSYSKVPRPQVSPEENARMFSVYMRPWTLETLSLIHI